jgi:two-component system phosphate regulon response regulator PhoB
MVVTFRSPREAGGYYYDMASLSPAPPRVLVVDDERDLLALVSFNLGQAGFEVQSATRGQEALAAVRRARPSVVVLDVMLPDLSGVEVCRNLRADPDTTDLAVLMLTARGAEADRLLGFEVGADDYVVKPFSVRELVMRVRALARRVEERHVARVAAGDGARLRWRGLVIDPGRQEVTADGAPLSLRPLEYKLLSLFLEHAGRIFSRRELLAEVWGLSPALHTRTVDVHMRRLRVSLGAYGRAIETIHGLGYRLRDAGGPA